MQRGSLRVFDGVLVYPLRPIMMRWRILIHAARYMRIVYVFKETSLQQFFENYDEIRNLLTDIWDNGTRYLGVRLTESMIILSRPAVLVDTAESTAGFTASGDAVIFLLILSCLIRMIILPNPIMPAFVLPLLRR